ncbi:hypothetical protein VMT65_22445 [Nocardia sp. CDC153]|uniref:hypothetical protein n=1 Tax=Nocardia sp. CDC153 TaxID=3112167 RepID=UPI002DBEDC01|nr:hypothetical protein [Nocardia sp. CDC153]MEC3955810.1 hypothetical protein [Nocardia sp. CDC153]
MIGNMLYAHISGVRERVLGMSEEKDIPTECFNELLEHYLANGWRRIYEYDGPDAWIDYGRVHLEHGKTVLRFRWNNYDEGSVAGSRKDIETVVHYVCASRNHNQ